MWINKIGQNLAILLLLVSSVSAQNNARNIDCEIIIRLKQHENFRALEYMSLNRSSSFHILKKLAQSQPIFLLEANDCSNKNNVINELQRQPFTQLVAANKHITKNRKKPNDEFFQYQWNFERIRTEQAWDVSTGGLTAQGDTITVAVMDEGYYINHPDIKGSIKTNTLEKIGDANEDGCPGDCGVDDDGDGLIDEDRFGRVPGDPNYDSSSADDDDENGYIDDIYGLYTTNDSDKHKIHNHGTAVTGIIGAETDNMEGVAGISWNAKILLVSDGRSEADVVEGYNYMYDMRKAYDNTGGKAGAYVVVSNYSLGVDFAVPDSFPFWCPMYDQLGSGGILSCVAVTNETANIDQEGDMPGLCPSEYMIAVTASNTKDKLNDCGYGPDNVDIAAPGEDTYTISFSSNNLYKTFGGTSAATPHVAGSIGLIYSLPCEAFALRYKNRPDLVYEIKDKILEYSEPGKYFKNLTKSGKILDIGNVMQQINMSCLASLDDINLSNIRNSLTTDYFGFSYRSRKNRNETIRYFVFNMLGQKVIEQELRPNFPNYTDVQIDVSKLVPGTYIFTIVQANKVSSQKFIKI